MLNSVFHVMQSTKKIVAVQAFSLLARYPLFNRFLASKVNTHFCYMQTFPYKPVFSVDNIRCMHLTASLKKKVTLYFVDRHGEKHKATATVGDSLLDVIIDNDFNFETYGVCEGTISCSTCHVILDPDTFSDMEDPLMDELDMLDLACGLTETSRLGCQVYVTEEMDGVTIKLPEEITDARDL